MVPPADDLVLASGGCARMSAALVVVGGADGPAERMRFDGSVRTSLVRTAQCPVAVVPAVPRLGGREVICGVRDWADVATATVASCFAGALGLPLRLIHILPPAAGQTRSLAALERPWDHETAYRLLELVANSVGGSPSLLVEPGSGGRRLAHVATAREAGLLVVGPPIRGRLETALTGSVSAHLIRRSQRPLIVCCGVSVPGLPNAG